MVVQSGLRVITIDPILRAPQRLGPPLRPSSKALTDGEHPGPLRRRQVLPDDPADALARRRDLSSTLLGFVLKDGRDDTEPHRQRYECRDCRRRFDDLTDTIFAGHHQPLRTWIGCLYLMGLNLSGLQIAEELDINKDDARAMIQQLREGIVARRPPVVLEGEVECDEVYVVAGHKGHPEAVKKKGGPPGEDA